MDLFEFNVEVSGSLVAVECGFNDKGYPVNLQSPHSDKNQVFDAFEDLYLKVRRRDRDGDLMRHDARVCSSKLSNNNNLDLRVELSDIYIQFGDLCAACAFVARERDNGLPVAFNDDSVIGHAIVTYL